MRQIDVAIIGAGSAGLAALREVRRFTSRFVLIHGSPDGTTCARVGCMPSKGLIEIAADFHRRRVFSKEGILGGQRLSLDASRALARVRSLRDDFVEGPEQAVAALGVRALAGYAHFVEPTLLDVGGRLIRAKSVIIATGSRPWVPPQWRSVGKGLLTSDGVFELECLPRSMAVIGLGAVGLELSQALSRLGAAVTAFGRSSFIGGLDDPAVSRRAVEIIGKEFRLLQGHPAEIGAKGKALTVSSGHRRVRVDKVLAAIGRRPNIESLRLEGLGIKVAPNGLPEFDPSTMQLGELPIFWAGDVSADRPVLHEALDAGRIAGYNAVQAASACFARRVRLRITFSRPNIASIGAPWAELKDADISVGETDFASQGRAVLMSENAGLLRVYAQRRSGRLLGAQLAAPGGEHIAHLIAMAIQRGMTAAEALETPFYHPALEEGLKDALSALAGKRIRGKK